MITNRSTRKNGRERDNLRIRTEKNAPVFAAGNVDSIRKRGVTSSRTAKQEDKNTKRGEEKRR